AADELRSRLSALRNPTAAATAVDQLLSTTRGALGLLVELQQERFPAATRDLAIKKGIGAPTEQVRDLFRRFDPNEQSADRLGTSINTTKLLALRGDAS